MQATEADIQHLKNKGDEDAINFRPSPNFKHMKKYLKSKFEESANASSAGSGEEEERVNGVTSTMMQPPLPPNPPPPDSPLQITLKEEVVDDDYQNNEEPRNQESEETPNEYVPPSTSAGTNQKDKIMCRQFARGACTRGASCIYVHELILDQLPGIYTFCKNFQNSGCNFPKCKFVHASVFEKEYFYRTGYLPPHSLAHLKENNTVQPPAPVPDVAGSGPSGGAPPDVAAPFPTPPPVMLPSSSGGGAEALGALAAASHKRDWLAARTDLGGGGGARSEGDELAEPAAKKCKNCDLNEFRLQCNKNKAEKLMRATEEIDKKISQLNKKNSKLYTVVIALLRNSHSAKSGTGSSILNNRNDKEKALLEKLNMLFSSNNRHSLLDDTSKNMSTVLVRLLLSTGDAASGDPS